MSDNQVWTPPVTELEKLVEPLVKDLRGRVANFYVANNIYRIIGDDGRQFMATWGEIECRFEERGRFETVVEVEEYDPIKFMSNGFHTKYLFHDEYESNRWPSNILFLQGHEFSRNSIHLIDKKVDTRVYFDRNRMRCFRKGEENFTPEQMVDIAMTAGHCDVDPEGEPALIADMISVHQMCFRAIKHYLVNEIKVGMPARSIYHDHLVV